jgi:hypothetical protein
MLILADSKMPEAAKHKLHAYGEVVEFKTEGITYEAISGHPDIFFCPSPGGLIVAPNLPREYSTILDLHNIRYTKGKLPVGFNYPETARYNSLFTDHYIIQSHGISDASIQNMNPDLELISVRQGYIRCNLLALPNNTFITSDRGIEKSLKLHSIEVHFVDPKGVKLDGFEHGFFGGACGLNKNTLYLCGSISSFSEHQSVKEFCSHAEVQLIELFEGPPIDVGTILFL